MRDLPRICQPTNLISFLGGPSLWLPTAVADDGLTYPKSMLWQLSYMAYLEWLDTAFLFGVATAKVMTIDFI